MRTPFLATSIVLHATALGVAAVVIHGGGPTREPARVNIVASEEAAVLPPPPVPRMPVAVERAVDEVLSPDEVAPVMPEPEAADDAAGPAPSRAGLAPPAARIVPPEPVVPPPAEPVASAAPPPARSSARVDAVPLDDRNQPPEYPALARQLGQHGTVRIRLHLDDRGDVLDAEIVEPCAHAELNRAALRAVRAWKFVPATVDGAPVADAIVVPVVFRLADR